MIEDLTLSESLRLQLIDLWSEAKKGKVTKKQFKDIKEVLSAITVVVKNDETAARTRLIDATVKEKEASVLEKQANAEATITKSMILLKQNGLSGLIGDTNTELLEG